MTTVFFLKVQEEVAKSRPVDDERTSRNKKSRCPLQRFFGVRQNIEFLDRNYSSVRRGFRNQEHNKEKESFCPIVDRPEARRH